MEFLRKGSDPPPYFWNPWGGAHLIFGDQKGEKQNFQKNTTHGHI